MLVCCFQLAEARFRGLPFGALLGEVNHFTGFHGSLAEKTQPARLGDVDAFISHSWHDDGKIKLVQLTRWAKRLEDATGRMPFVWLECAPRDRSKSFSLACLALLDLGASAAEDASPMLSCCSKACIDQTDIEQDLGCLPVFLSGCRSFVMVVGETYVTRLWVRGRLSG